MASLRKTALLGAAMAAFATAAQAADFPEPLPEYPPYVPPPVEFKGWYLRGHIGMASQDLDRLHHPDMDTAGNFQWLDTGSFDAAPIFGVGIGYRLNDMLRFDATGEYRGKAHFAALDRHDFGVNDYTAKKSEWLFLLNGYWDVLTWKGLTPYVGAGVGASYNMISNFRDTNVIAGGGGYAGNGEEWNFAWAVHAGVGFEATENLTIDLGYSYVNLGDAKTGTLLNFDPAFGCEGGGTCAPMRFKDLTSHDFKIGLRWALGGGKGFDFKPHKDDYGPPPVYKY